MSKPLSPDEIGLFAQKAFPAFVFEAVNTLLARNTNGTLYQDDVIDEILRQASLVGEYIDRSDIFNKGYLDFEEAYRAVGWSVTYDKPAYCENYKAHFIFKRKK